MLFSIIIPVYNSSKYIVECLNSVANQTFNDYEVIIINDGSTDNSEELILNFCDSFSNFKLTNKKNGGAAVARNVGIELSEGEYLIFLDGDDYWINSDALLQLANLIEKNNYPDLMLHEESRLFPNGDTLYENNIALVKNGLALNFKEDLKTLIFNELFVASPCDKIVKREIVTENSIYFPVGLKSEDMLWTFNLIPYIDTYLFYEDTFYMYRQLVDGSSTNTVSEKHLNDILFMIDEGLENHKVASIIRQSYWAEHYAFLLMNFNYVSPKSKTKFYIKYKEKGYLLKGGATKNVDKVYNFYRVLGLKNTIFLLNIFRKINYINKKYRIIR